MPSKCSKSPSSKVTTFLLDLKTEPMGDYQAVLNFGILVDVLYGPALNRGVPVSIIGFSSKTGFYKAFGCRGGTRGSGFWNSGYGFWSLLKWDLTFDSRARRTFPR